MEEKTHGRIWWVLHKLWPYNSLYDQAGATPDQKRGMNASVIGPLFCTVFGAVSGGTVYVAFANKLGMNDFVFGIVNSVSTLSVVFMLVASWWVEKTQKRKAIMLSTLITSRALWTLMALIPWAIPSSHASLRILCVVLIMGVTGILNQFGTIASTSWFADMLPLSIRGRYLALRNSIMNMVNLGVTFLVGAIIERANGSMAAYSAMFVIGAVFGIIDILCYAHVKEPPMKKNDSPNFFHGMKECLKNADFRYYTMFWSLWAFGWCISVPFFGKYAMETLQISLLGFTLISVVMYSLIIAVAYPIWGKFFDKHGRQRSIRWGILGNTIATVCWLFAAPGQIWGVLGYFLFNSIMICGVDLSSQHMLISVTPQKNRTLYLAVFNLFNCAVGSTLGSFVGGSILQWLGDISIPMGLFTLDRYKIVFVIAAVFRVAVTMILLPRIGRMKDIA